MDEAQIVVLDFEEDNISMERYKELKKYLKAEYPKVRIMMIEEDLCHDGT